MKKQLEHLLLSASDYVCVLDVDLLELVIKTWKGSTEGKLVSVAQSPPELESSKGQGNLQGIAPSPCTLSSLLLPGPGLRFQSLPALLSWAVVPGPPGKGETHPGLPLI